ncbi:unnamed protein product [Durusdinium trenchii]|uniref:Fe2OG dioxygenase domain-containing protein n=1 Tax=Durusdinium trenchii TaxID=1381693 RepID=A0ABP0MKX3_9DINO
MLPTPLTCEGESCVLQRSHREAPPSLWPTEVVLPLRSQMQVLSAWYGHPSDPGRRLDVSERVKALLEGHEHLGSGLGNLLRESLHRDRKLCLPASTQFWGQDPAPFVWKKLEVKLRPPVPPPRYEGRFSALRPGGAQAEQLAWAVKHFEVDEVRRLLRRWPAGAALTDKEDNTLFHLAAGETARAAARREQAEEASPKTSFLGLRAAEGVCGTSRRLRRGGRPDWTMPVISWMSLVALRRGSTRPRVVCGCVPKNLVEGWVVKYQRDGPESTSLGLAVVDEKGRLQPLCTWEEDERTFVVNEDADAIDAEDRVVQLLDVMVSHRQMPRPVNPHGEEVEDTYLVDEEEDLSDVEIVVVSLLLQSGWQVVDQKNRRGERAEVVAQRLDRGGAAEEILRSRSRSFQEASRAEVPLQLIGEMSPVPWTWQYPVQDEQRRSFAGVNLGAFPKETCRRWMKTLTEQGDWIQLPGVPREVIWYVSEDCADVPYRYSGLEFPAVVYPEVMMEIREELCKLCGIPEGEYPNSCNVNIYQDGSQEVGWHSDDEVMFQGLAKDTRILSLSLGAARDFYWRLQGTSEALGVVSLGDGDVATMEGLFQKHYKHAVPASEQPCGPRINLTFRWIKVKAHAADAGTVAT